MLVCHCSITYNNPLSYAVILHKVYIAEFQLEYDNMGKKAMLQCNTIIRHVIHTHTHILFAYIIMFLTSCWLVVKTSH